MNASLLAVLDDAERLLVAQTERAELAALDEDAAIDLEARIRRARNKYVGQYRRAASARVVGSSDPARPSRLHRRCALIPLAAATVRSMTDAAERRAQPADATRVTVMAPVTGKRGDRGYYDETAGGRYFEPLLGS
jgi:hypothetical protein